MTQKMKYNFALCCCLVLFLFSCKNEDDNRLADTQKEVQKKKVLVKSLQKAWDFYDTPLTEASETSIASWNELRLFLDALAQKPQASVRAYQRKSAELSKKVIALGERIPYQYDKPQIRSRIAALTTKVRMLDLFMHLDVIPDKKVSALVAEINLELLSVQRQMDEIVEKSKIQLEEGESDLLRMLDSSRAIPNTPIVDPNIPRVE